jgi:hypothetical protein
MSDPLSISNLLSLLQVDRGNDAIRLCDEAENLRRRHYYEKAVEASSHAERIAHSVFDYELQGATLLYLGTMHAFRSESSDGELAVRYCERAVRAFRRNTHNYAIAQLIRARIELHLEQKDEAVVHFYSTTQILQKLIVFSREHRQGQMVALYESLYNATNAAIAKVYASLTEVKPVPIARKKTRQPAISAASTTQFSAGRKQQNKESSPMDLPFPLPVPMKIVWPTQTSLRLELSPVYVSATDSAAIQPDLSENALDYIQLSGISINGKPFAIQPIYPASGDLGNTLKIYRDKQYVPVLVQTDVGRGEFNNTYLLVRRQDRPDHEDQYIVVDDLIDKHAWVDRCESEAPYTHIQIIGAERQWDIPSEKEPHVIGVVEAWLKPLA